jgi:predicted nuclease of predicted toxin-antitoxin system
MRFLIDAQLPPALVQLFQGAGHVAEHVYGLELLDRSDKAVWEYALREQTVIVSKDEDFATLVQSRSRKTPVVWIRIGNCSNRALLQKLAPILKGILSRLESGEFLIEVVG